MISRADLRPEGLCHISKKSGNLEGRRGVDFSPRGIIVNWPSEIRRGPITCDIRHSKKMAKKTPIDRQRDSAGYFDVGTEGDQTGISGFLDIGGKFHVVKPNYIYEVKFADDIDPDRTNPKIPNTQALNYGSDDVYVAQVLLTAQALFPGRQLQVTIDAARALELAFDCTKDLITLRDGCTDLAEAQRLAEETFRQQQVRHGAVGLPSIPDLKKRFESLTHSANQAEVSLV